VLCSQSVATHYKTRTGSPVQGATYLAMETAVSEFRIKLQNPQIGKYDIEILDTDNQVIVMFQNKGKHNEGFRGNPGPLPEFEVVLNATNLKIISSNFVR